MLCVYILPVNEDRAAGSYCTLDPLNCRLEVLHDIFERHIENVNHVVLKFLILQNITLGQTYPWEKRFKACRNL